MMPQPERGRGRTRRQGGPIRAQENPTAVVRPEESQNNVNLGPVVGVFP